MGWWRRRSERLSVARCLTTAAAAVICLPAWGDPERDLQLQLLQSLYLGQGQNQTQSDSYSSLGVRLRLKSDTETKRAYGLDVLGLTSMDGTEQGYIAAPEFYLGFNAPVNRGSLRAYVGRKRYSWSQFDDEWRLGIWQPYVRWDYLHPRPQGLTGAFLGMKGGDAEVMAFASPLFLPDQGPQFEVENGEFHSSNRWFSQPTSRHTVMNQTRRLNYELDRLAEGEIINHTSYGLSVAVGGERSGPWLRTSMANKPINQLHLGIEGYHSITRVNRYLESVAIVHPTVARHTVVTVEAGIREEEYQTWVSITEERPDNPDLPEEWEEASLYSSRFIGFLISHRLPWAGWRGNWLKYGYLNLTEDLPPQNLNERQDTLESSLDRYPFKEVLSFEWTAPVINRAARRLDLGLRYLYSVPEKGSLLSAKAEFLVNRTTRWDLGVDILGAEVPSDHPNSGLMSRYRHNDRVLGGLTYVF